MPIPAGATLPCHDCPLEAQYGRCMLMLFKPWQHAADIRGNHDSWMGAFESWRDELVDEDLILTRMKNVQLLNECKDACDSQLFSRRH